MTEPADRAPPLPRPLQILGRIGPGDEAELYPEPVIAEWVPKASTDGLEER